MQEMDAKSNSKAKLFGIWCMNLGVSMVADGKVNDRGDLMAGFLDYAFELYDGRHSEAYPDEFLEKLIQELDPVLPADVSNVTVEKTEKGHVASVYHGGTWYSGSVTRDAVSAVYSACAAGTGARARAFVEYFVELELRAKRS